MTGPAVTSGGLERLEGLLAARRRPRPAEACDLCSDAVPAEHGHLVEVTHRRLLCACRPCYLLFTTGHDGRFLAVPDRYLAVEPFRLDRAQWDALQVPVSIAFFLVNSALGETAAFYPSPGGATESLLDLGAWEEVIQANPALRDVAPDVEAVLVHARDDGFRCWIVPVDRCYELVGALRLTWRGFDGGQEARERVDAFLADVAARSRPAGRAP